ncbi:MAG: MTH1187 family thiamine-binding protein [Acidobacteria bacterium]|nr:MTH1187 family thiamine-binding protein [Acidobacteriota bacterium]MBU4306538.1 MTH1187 family thiamine-binding protein [Acidobacteriota bacterium]MBU4405140.1 MTH1187 family thiamine-binding protein [Acidobacteriota bacterium]MCG2810738.1 MTH1187 family thiamine-binding protein [Candidatus Aminicenantes bacterium]
MGKIIAEVTVVPLGTATTSLSQFVAEGEKALKNFPAVISLLTPMSTILEGEMAEVLAAVQAMHETPFQNGARRVMTCISIDDRRDREITMEGKLAAVKSKL